eukprot:1729649-Prorocentrum_lima.AAC.1
MPPLDSESLPNATRGQHAGLVGQRVWAGCSLGACLEHGVSSRLGCCLSRLICELHVSCVQAQGV